MESTFFLQQISKEVWESKYQLKDKNGNILENDISDTFKRVAYFLSKNENDKELWEEKFYKILSEGKFIGGGRIMSNAGAFEYKQNTSLINCTVMNQIPDSMEGIMQVLKESAKTLQRGSGVGYDFSTIRPKGALVRGVGAGTSGPLSFMEIYDKMCFTIQSAGGRRGAQMGVMDCQHPDIEDFISSKRENGKLRQFNLSILITKNFMDAVINNKNWNLWFWERTNLSFNDIDSKKVKVIKKGDIPFNYSDYEYFIFDKNHTEVEYGNIKETEIFKKRIYKSISAVSLWDSIMKSNYEYAEPGFILIDEVNEKNNLWWIETIRATNPCGEQPLPPYGACLLGSMILPSYVENEFTDKAFFNFDKFKEDIKTAARLLDNVVEYSGLPLKEQLEEISNKRRHGMGFTGLADTFVMLKMKYGSKESIKLTEEITKTISVCNYEAGIEIGFEKGIAPVLNEFYNIDDEILNKLYSKFTHEEINIFKEKKLFIDNKIKGSVLHAVSEYFNFFPKDLLLKLAINGCRFTHATSIAPSGTISLVSNNVSSGIEPIFTYSYFRNVIVSGKKTKTQQEVMDYAYLKYKTQFNTPVLPNYFVSSENITVEDHINIQAAAQKYIDTSISKTINVKTDCSYDDFKNIYINAYKKGLKGVTTFRYNPNFSSGVMVTKENLEKTFYEFTLESGNVVKFKGNDKVFYEGEEHIVSNLFEALKEGYYGKY